MLKKICFEKFAGFRSAHCGGVYCRPCFQPISCFYYGQIRTLVAMATYSLHRLIMGKVEIGNRFFFYRNVY